MVVCGKEDRQSSARRSPAFSARACEDLRGSRKPGSRAGHLAASHRGTTDRCRCRGLGRRTGGIHGIAQPSARRYRHGVRPDSTPRSGPREPSDGAALQNQQNACFGSERRDARRGQLCLCDSAPLQSEHFRWSPRYPTPASQRPQHANRLFSPRPGGGPGPQGARRHSVGNRVRRDARSPSDQGRGRRHLRAGNGNREV